MDTNKTIVSTLHKAILDHQSGRLPQAEQLYRSILAIQPDHPDANHNLGIIAVQVKKPEAGLPYLRLALQTNPNQGQYWISYIEALIRSNRLQEAHDLLMQGQKYGLKGDAFTKLLKCINLNSKLIEQSESNAPAAAIDQNSHNTATASNLSQSQRDEPVKRFSEETPHKGRAQPSRNCLNNVMSLINKKKILEAATLAKQITEQFPNYGLGFKILGFLFTQLGKHLEAKNSLYRAHLLLPNDPEVHYNLGVTYQALNNFYEAEKSYRLSLELKPKFAEAHNNLGSILVALGREIEAEFHLRQAISLKPNYPEALNNLGNLFRDLKQVEQAESYLRKALSIRPNYAEAHNNLGNLLRDIKQIEQAEQHIRRALSINSKYADAYNNLANLLKDRGLLNDAVKNYKLAHDIRPEEANFLLNLGHALLSQDKINEAVVAYHKTINVAPTSKGLEAAVYLAIIFFIGGIDQQSRKFLDLSREMINKNINKLKNSQIYWCLIDQLLLWHQQHTAANYKVADGFIYSLGESHSLSANRLILKYNNQNLLCKTEWIAGCKQWHLGNNLPNEYKFKFEAIMERLPRESSILLCIGEIDCRHDEGIIKAWKKTTGQSLEKFIDSTIKFYIAYVTDIAAKYNHVLIISGVPAPNIQMNVLANAKGDTAELLVRIIKIFNLCLKKHVVESGLKFLDVYELTDQGDGISNQKYHLDSHHLKPSAIVEAFENYLA